MPMLMVKSRTQDKIIFHLQTHIRCDILGSDFDINEFNLQLNIVLKKQGGLTDNARAGISDSVLELMQLDCGGVDTRSTYN